MNKKARKHRRTVWIIVLLLFALFADSHFRFVKSEYELSYDNLPEAFDGFRIVQISDLHMREYGEDNSKLLDAVSSEDPDIIVITGDLINRSAKSKNIDQTEQIKPFIDRLTEIAPCYFVSGNHEWDSGELPRLISMLEDDGVKCLKNEYISLDRDGESIILAGVDDPNGYADMATPEELVAQLREKHPNDFVVLLGHRNYWLDKFPDLDVDLIFSGHAHGGMWRIPFVGGLISTERTLFPKNTEGVCHGNRYDMVVSRGLGDSSDAPRLFNNPELVTAILHSGK